MSQLIADPRPGRGAVAILVVALALCSGCGSSSGGQPAPSAPEESNGETAPPAPARAPDCPTAYPDVDACRQDIRARLKADGPDAVLVELAGLRARHPADWQAAYLEAWTRYRTLGLARAAESRPYFDEALGLARAAGDDGGVAQCLLMLGAVAEMGEEDAESAGHAYEEAARAAERAGDDQVFFQAAWALSTIKRQLGSYAEQVEWLRRALATLAPDDEGGYRRAGQYALANAHRKLGDVRTSRALLESTLAMAGRADDPYDRSSVLMLQGVLELDHGDPAEAIGLFERSRDVARAGGLESIANHADMLVGVAQAITGDAAEARARLLSTLDDSLAYAEESPEWTTQGVVNLLFLGEAERRLGMDAEALEHYGRARERAAAWRKPDLAWQASGGLASLHLRRGRLDDAIREAERGVDEIETLRSRVSDDSQRLYFLRQRSNVYVVLASALAASGAPVGRAFDVVERAHARTLRAALMADTTSEASPSLAAVQAALGPGELLLGYLLGEDESLLLAVTGESAELHRLPARRVIEDAVAEWTAVLLRPLTSVDARVDPLADFVRLADRGRRLRDMLLAPVEERVAAAGRLIVIPDKQLHRLPFGTLPGPGLAADGAPPLLAGDVALSYVPASSFVIDRAPPPAGPVVVVANGAGRPSLRLPTLRSAGSETDAIRAAWPEGEVAVAADDRATPAALRRMLAGPVGVLHVVGHALLHPVAGPRIVLSGPDEGYALLDAADIAELAPTPPLVVLSACETGEGELVGGEGILGLVRAFTLAGSTQVVATRWSTDDEIAARLMGGFHERLRSGSPASVALSEARRELLADGFVHPFSWAGFAVYGADESRADDPS